MLARAVLGDRGPLAAGARVGDLGAEVERQVGRVLQVVLGQPEGVEDAAHDVEVTLLARMAGDHEGELVGRQLEPHGHHRHRLHRLVRRPPVHRRRHVAHRHRRHARRVDADDGAVVHRLHHPRPNDLRHHRHAASIRPRGSLHAGHRPEGQRHAARHQRHRGDDGSDAQGRVQPPGAVPVALEPALQAHERDAGRQQRGRHADAVHGHQHDAEPGAPQCRRAEQDHERGGRGDHAARHAHGHEPAARQRHPGVVVGMIVVVVLVVRVVVVVVLVMGVLVVVVVVAVRVPVVVMVVCLVRGVRMGVGMTVPVPVAVPEAVAVVVMAGAAAQAPHQQRDAGGHEQAAAGERQPRQHAVGRHRLGRPDDQPQRQHARGVRGRHRGADREHLAGRRTAPGDDRGRHHGLAVARRQRVQAAEHERQRHRQQAERHREPVVGHGVLQAAGEPVGAAGGRAGRRHRRRPCGGHRGVGPGGERGAHLAGRRRARRVGGQQRARAHGWGVGGDDPHPVAAHHDLAPADAVDVVGVLHLGGAGRAARAGTPAAACRARPARAGT